MKLKKLIVEGGIHVLVFWEKCVRIRTVWVKRKITERELKGEMTKWQMKLRLNLKLM